MAPRLLSPQSPVLLRGMGGCGNPAPLPLPPAPISCTAPVVSSSKRPSSMVGTAGCVAMVNGEPGDRSGELVMAEDVSTLALIVFSWEDYRALIQVCGCVLEELLGYRYRIALPQQAL